MPLLYWRFFNGPLIGLRTMSRASDCSHRSRPEFEISLSLLVLHPWALQPLCCAPPLILHWALFPLGLSRLMCCSSQPYSIPSQPSHVTKQFTSSRVSPVLPTAKLQVPWMNTWNNENMYLWTNSEWSPFFLRSTPELTWQDLTSLIWLLVFTLWMSLSSHFRKCTHVLVKVYAITSPNEMLSVLSQM